MIDKRPLGYDKVKNSMGLLHNLQGSRLMAWTTKSPIRGNPCVPWGCRAHLGSVNTMPKQRIFLNFTEGFLRFELAQNILQPVKGQGINELTGVSNSCKVNACLPYHWLRPCYCKNTVWRGSLLVLGMKEGLVECATVCIKSEVIRLTCTT